MYLFIANSAIASHSSQSFCLWSTKNWRYCSNSWFIHLVCLSVYKWKTVNNFVLIPNILFSFFVNSTANCSLLFDTMLSGNPCNFQMLSLNMSKLKAVDPKLFSFSFYFLSSFQIIFLSILKTRIRVTRSYGHTSVTSDDRVTSHKMHRRT